MPFSIRCPHCNSRLTAKDDKLAGKTMPCPKCKKPFTVELSSVVTAEPAKPLAAHPKSASPQPATPPAAKPHVAPVQAATPQAKSPTAKPQTTNAQPSKSQAPAAATPKTVSKPATPQPAAAVEPTPAGLDDLGNMDLGDFDFGTPPAANDPLDFGANAFPSDPLAPGPLDLPVETVASQPTLRVTPPKPQPKEPVKPPANPHRNLIIGLSAAGVVFVLLCAGSLIHMMLSGSSGNEEVASTSPVTQASVGSPIDSPAPAEPAAPAAAVPDAGDAIESATLKKRLEDRFLWQFGPSSQGSADLANQVATATQEEIAKMRRLHDKFLMVAADQEAMLKKGQPLRNSVSRMRLLTQALRTFDLEFALPPGMDKKSIEHLTDAMDAELTAHYLEAGMLALVSQLDEQRAKESQPAITAMIRILREEDLSAIKSMADVEQLVQSRRGNVKAKPAQTSQQQVNSPAPSNGTNISRNNLKQIALAIHNYHDHFLSMPAEIQIGPKGVPHSWRVTLLPMIGKQELFDRYHLDEPWDSPHNLSLLSEMPEIYRAPGADPTSTETAYFGFTPPTISDARPAEWMPALCGTKANKFADIHDGTSNCLLVVESKVSVPWTKPDDIPISADSPVPNLGGIHAGGFWGAMCDGSVRFFPDFYDRQMLKLVLQCRDGQPVQMPEEVAQKRAEEQELQRLSSSTDPADHRKRSMANLRQIGLALHNYHDAYKVFPAAVQVGPKNVPHSWRVSILPYLKEGELYTRYKQDEPWDSPHNKSLLTDVPEVFRAPGTASNSTNASYFGFALSEAAENLPEPQHPVLAGSRCTRLASIVDGLSNCLMVVEAKAAVPWTKPEEIPFDPQSELPPMGKVHPGGFMGAMCDGSVRFFPDSLDRSLLLKIIQRGDGAPVEIPPPSQ